MSAPMLMKPRRVTADQLYLNLWVYGDAGCGKTTLAASALDHHSLGPALFINIEGGLLSVAGRGDIDAVEIASPEDIDRITYAVLTKHPDFAQYKTIIVDSLTELQTVSLTTVVQAAMLKAPGRDRTVDDIEIGDYGKSSTQMRRLIGALRNAPVHVIFTGLAKREYPKGADPKMTQPTAVGPSLTSKLADHAMGAMDMVWYMYLDAEDNQRKILTQSYNQFRAKTRGPRFAEAMGLVHTNPHLPTLYDLLLHTEGNNNGNHAPAHMFAMNPTTGPQAVAIMPVTEIPTEPEVSVGENGEAFGAPIPGLSPEALAPAQVGEHTFTSPGVTELAGSPFSAAPAQITSMPIPASTQGS